MIFRVAQHKDIPQLKEVRMSVIENMLTDSALISDKDYAEHLRLVGKGWVCEIDKQVVGFSFVNIHTKNIWASEFLYVKQPQCKKN